MGKTVGKMTPKHISKHRKHADVYAGGVRLKSDIRGLPRVITLASTVGDESVNAVADAIMVMELGRRIDVFMGKHIDTDWQSKLGYGGSVLLELLQRVYPKTYEIHLYRMQVHDGMIKNSLV